VECRHSSPQDVRHRTCERATKKEGYTCSLTANAPTIRLLPRTVPPVVTSLAHADRTIPAAIATVSTRVPHSNQRSGSSAAPEGKRRQQQRAIVGDALDGCAVVQQRVNDWHPHACVARVDAGYPQVQHRLRLPACARLGQHIHVRSGFEQRVGDLYCVGC
jgi:hypothetical protein